MPGFRVLHLDQEEVSVIERLVFIVVNRGKANAVLRTAKECGASSATIFLGEAIPRNTLKEKLGLVGLHKEIVMIQSSGKLCEDLYLMFDGAHAPFKAGGGYMFSVPFKQWRPADEPEIMESEKTEPGFSHSCIIIIADRGRGIACIESAKAAGVVDGVLVHGRGAGVPKDFYVPLIIEPQKDILLTFVANDRAGAVRSQMYADLELDRPGHGILFTLPVFNPVGFLSDGASSNREQPA